MFSNINAASRLKEIDWSIYRLQSTIIYIYKKKQLFILIRNRLMFNEKKFKTLWLNFLSFLNLRSFSIVLCFEIQQKNSKIKLTNIIFIHKNKQRHGQCNVNYNLWWNILSETIKLAVSSCLQWFINIFPMTFKIKIKIMKY